MEEVDHFHDFLRPQLEQKGFQGLFVEKRNSPCLQFTPNNGPDGCALFYRSSKLTLLKKKELVLNREDGTKSNQVAMMVQLQLSLGGSETSKDLESESKDDARMPSGEQGSETLGKEPSGKGAAVSMQTICVAVTHLKAKQEGRELRLAQGKHLLSHIQSFAESDNHPVILCGDFNATPDEPVYGLFSGSNSPLKLSSSNITPYYDNKEPPLTSWKFRAGGESKYTIDYIWFTSGTLKVDSIWTIPTEEDIGKDGLPCLRYPSDHVSICTCFKVEK